MFEDDVLDQTVEQYISLLKSKAEIINSNVLCYSIPESLRKLQKHAFKKQIHNLSLLSLQRQDSYADINTLINEIKKGLS